MLDFFWTIVLPYVMPTVAAVLTSIVANRADKLIDPWLGKISSRWRLYRTNIKNKNALRRVAIAENAIYADWIYKKYVSHVFISLSVMLPFYFFLIAITLFRINLDMHKIIAPENNTRLIFLQQTFDEMRTYFADYVIFTYAYVANLFLFYNAFRLKAIVRIRERQLRNEIKL